MSSLLIVHQGALGDFILSLPAVEALHQYFSQARFTFIAHPRILHIIRGRPYFQEALDCTASRWAPLYQAKGRMAAAELKSRSSVESIFVFGGSSSQILADNLASSLGKPAHRIDPFPEPDLGLRPTDYQCLQLEKLGIPATPPPAAVIAPLDQDQLAARAFLRHALAPGERLVVLHPGSGGRKKLWALAGWLSLIQSLSSQSHLRLALLQGPADEHIVRQLCDQLRGALPITVKNWSLGKLAALIRLARLYLGSDSGITHLAAACGTPTIALFCATDPGIWAPRGPRVEVIRSRRQGGGFPDGSTAESKEISGPPPETSLVWKKASQWLGVGES